SCNTPANRTCWTAGFDTSTNYYQKWPATGQQLTYDLRITNGTCNPDGHSSKTCFLVNGQYPGPAIRASWGDSVRVTVHNDLQINGTSIHFHGLRQFQTCQNDGTNGVTECPIAPGESRSYQWTATEYGTSWYHSHHSVQYSQGILGPIIIDGPTTQNYDQDLGALPLTDWYYDDTFMLLWRALYGGGAPPPAQNVLVNGSMIDGFGHGKYSVINVVKGQTYKLRLINAATDTLFHVSMDNHPFTVVGADFVAVDPYQTTDLKMNIGQRYDIVFTANQTASNYWLRVRPGAAVCGSPQIYNATHSDVVVGAILRYSGAPAANPTSTGYTMAATCEDETYSNHLKLNVPSTTFAAQEKPIDITLGTGPKNIANWFINGSSLDVDWQNPTLAYILNGTTNYPKSENVFLMPQANAWYFWVIINPATPPLPHPVHLHGHDFYKLGSGTGPFPGVSALNFNNPMRRDVSTLPGSATGGWLVFGFPADNPGVWLTHCHIAWHVSEGFGMQFVERATEIPGTIGQVDEFNQGCLDWRNYWN
ncbi:hypothetical protein BT63DRAFT_359825, partial [Microthyrium microscopicum]